MIEWLNTKIGEVQTLVLAGASLLAAFFIISVWWRTKNIVQAVVAMVAAGAVLFAVANTDWFRQKVEEETSFAPVTYVAAANVTASIWSRSSTSS